MFSVCMFLNPLFTLFFLGHLILHLVVSRYISQLLCIHDRHPLRGMLPLSAVELSRHRQSYIGLVIVRLAAHVGIVMDSRLIVHYRGKHVTSICLLLVNPGVGLSLILEILVNRRQLEALIVLLRGSRLVSLFQWRELVVFDWRFLQGHSPIESFSNVLLAMVCVLLHHLMIAVSEHAQFILVLILFLSFLPSMPLPKVFLEIQRSDGFVIVAGREDRHLHVILGVSDTLELSFQKAIKLLVLLWGFLCELMLQSHLILLPLRRGDNSVVSRTDYDAPL